MAFLPQGREAHCELSLDKAMKIKYNFTEVYFGEINFA